MADFCTGKRCPKCGGRNCQLISETDYRSGKYGFGKGCCGYILFGLPGLICGLCGMESKSKSTAPIGSVLIAIISSEHSMRMRKDPYALWLYLMKLGASAGCHQTPRTEASFFTAGSFLCAQDVRACLQDSL